MILSFCIPCHNRAYDLKQTMPYLLAAAEESPPVEIVVLDYNSPDDLAKYIQSLQAPTVTYQKYAGRDTYHMAHARNLAARVASGEYIIVFSCDLYPKPEFVPRIRQLIDETQPVWIRGMRPFDSVVVCQKSEFVAAGGFDERFEFYGPEDKDLNDRLLRRVGPAVTYSRFLLGRLETTNSERVMNYRLKLNKRRMAHRMYPIYRENNARGVLVANEGLDWGKFNENTG